MFSEMSGKQEDCMNCIENLYWNFFKFQSFFLSLIGDFYHQLAIPSKFYEKSNGNLPDNVTLFGPGGGSWHIGLVRDKDTLFFKHGWRQFAKDHCLEENDFLIFTYNRDSYFRVRIFNGLTSCEKEASYCVKNCETAEHNNCPTKRKDRECSTESAIHNFDDEFVRCTSSEKSSSYSNHGISRGQLAIPEIRRKTRTKCLRFRRTIVSTEASTSVGGVKNISGSDKWLVSEDQKARAVQMAEAALTDDSFLSVMRPNQVHKIFYLGIPKQWLNRHLPLATKKVILRVGKSTWEAEYRYYDSGGCGRLRGGWERFAEDNNLEEHDVCLFKHALSEGDTVTVDVTIFRVVQEQTPPFGLTPGMRREKERPLTLNSGSGKEMLQSPAAAAKVNVDSGSGKMPLERKIAATRVALNPTAEESAPRHTALGCGSGQEKPPETSIPLEEWSERERKRIHLTINLNE